MTPATSVAAVLATSALALACQGNVLGSSAGLLPGGGGSGTQLGASGGGAAQPLPDSGPTDEELREKDPELFEIALSYFPAQTAAAGKKRLFRLTRQQLDLTAQRLLPEQYGVNAASSLPRDPLQTNYEYADNLGFSAASFTPFRQWVEQLAAKVKEAPSSIANCAAEEGQTPACLQAAARAFVTRAFRGVVTEEALQRYATFFTTSVAEVGLAQACADLVTVTLTAPGFAFRDEVTTDAAGRLQPAQLLQNLSYTLADSPPEALDLALPAADATPLGAQDIAQLAEQVLAAPAARAKLLRFFTAWLEVREPPDFDISVSAFPEFTPEVAAAVVADTRAFLAQQLGTALPSLRDVTEATSALVSAPAAFLYGLPHVPSEGAVFLDAAQRLGIFTQPAVIASHSGPTTTRLVKRGVFFTRKVMCLPLGVPPADVETTLPMDGEGTERERIEGVTAATRCAACHRFINPFGFMQENYDAIGRYRSMDAGKPIDSSINIDFLDEGPLSATTPVEALRGLSRSLRFQQCFTRQLFRFYSGRDEAPEDDPLLRQLFFELASSEAKGITTLLRGLAAAPAFSYRTEVP